jgi:tellurite resistance protein
MGHAEASRLLFGASAAITPFVMGLVIFRAAIAPPLPEALRPSWFILLVPPSLIYAHGVALFEGLPILENLFFLDLVLAAGLLAYASRFWRWSFGPAWWAFTFPLDALAYAAVRYAQNHPAGLWTAIAAVALLLAVFFVSMVLIRSLHELFRHLIRHGA